MKIKIFTTGGSIDKHYSLRSSQFEVGPPQVEDILQEANVVFEYEIEQILAVDSLEIDEDKRRRIVERVQADPHTHILITHGTDTMVHTGQALAGTPGKVIVLTGSMQPAAFKHSDAAYNIGFAIAALQILPDGVYIAINGRIFDPQRARKNLEMERFEEL